MAGDQGEYGSFPVRNDQQVSAQPPVSKTRTAAHLHDQESSQDDVTQDSSYSLPSSRPVDSPVVRTSGFVPDSSRPHTGTSGSYDPPQNGSLSPLAQYEVGRDSMMGSTIAESDYGDFSTTSPGANSEVNYATRYPVAGSRSGDYPLPRAKATNYGGFRAKSPSVMEAAIAPQFSPPPPPSSGNRSSYRAERPEVLGHVQHSSQASHGGSDIDPAPSYARNRDSVLLSPGAATVESRTASTALPSHAPGIFNAQTLRAPNNHHNEATEKENFAVKCDDVVEDSNKHIESEEMLSEEKLKRKRSRRIFLGILILVLLIGAAVGGGVGGKLAHDKAHAHDPRPDGASCDISLNNTECINYCSSTTGTCQNLLSLNDKCQANSECSYPLICNHDQCRQKSTSTLIPVYQLNGNACTSSSQCPRGLHCLNSNNTVIANSGTGNCGWQGCLADVNCYGDEFFCQNNVTSCGLLGCDTTSDCVTYLNAQSEHAYAAVATCTKDSFYSTATSICSLAAPTATTTSVS